MKRKAYLDQLYRTYVGLSDAQHNAISSYYLTSKPLSEAPKNVQGALINRGLFSKDGKITKLGESIVRVSFAIKRDFHSGNDEFEIPTPILIGKDAKPLDDPMKIARTPSAKAIKLTSMHVKFMRFLLHSPGASIFMLETIFPVFVFSDLISRGLASRHEDSHQIYPTEKGIVFMKECIAELSQKKGKRNG